MKYTQPELLEHLASSYVLGTLTGGARRRFERLQRDRADVRGLVTQWETRLGQLAVSVPAQQPSPQLWKAIAARTQPAATAAAANASPRGWLGWLKPAGVGLGGLAAGVIAASVLFVTAPGLFMTSDQIAMRTGEKLPQSYVGLLTDAQGNGKLLVSSLRHGKTLTVKVIGPITAPASGTLVLWAVPASGPAFALGPVPASGSAVSLLPDTSEKLLSKVSKLVVTLETSPAAVSPSATVLFSGNCAKLW
ncbi:anti-sigma factor [Polaromonas sp. YR568]|uniref:anti-sigma factor n=1 Tax=Polaromonas sp. YR568 TaxID=1855301 RepID=UPI0031377EE6